MSVTYMSDSKNSSMLKSLGIFCFINPSKVFLAGKVESFDGKSNVF
jgi:hypothetical protein